MMDTRTETLDDPRRIVELKRLIMSKRFLRELYLETYQKYADCLGRCPQAGKALELGSGGGFAKQILPDVLTSDTLPYAGVDKVIDARRLPFNDSSLRAILMLNVFHHIPDVEMFLHEAERCLTSGGRMLIIDQHPGLLSHWIYKYAHHEPYDPDAVNWKFESSGPLSGANGALTWIVFRRDYKRFQKSFSKLRLERYQPHTPLRYWISGGLKNWSMLPGWSFPLMTSVDRALARVAPQLGSFVDIEIVKH
jgi:SAM-dependent methyltransferase